MDLIDTRDSCSINTNFQRLANVIEQGASDPWTSPSIGANFSEHGGDYDTAGYYKEGDRVYLKGVVDCLGTNGTIFTLPVGYRPPNQKTFLANSTLARWDIQVYPNGNVGFQYNQATSLSLDKISFRTV